MYYSLGAPAEFAVGQIPLPSLPKIAWLPPAPTASRARQGRYWSHRQDPVRHPPKRSCSGHVDSVGPLVAEEQHGTSTGRPGHAVVFCAAPDAARTPWSQEHAIVAGIAERRNRSRSAQHRVVASQADDRAQACSDRLVLFDLHQMRRLFLGNYLGRRYGGQNETLDRVGCAAGSWVRNRKH